MRTLITLLPFALASVSVGQTLFSEDFEGSPAFTLNTTDAGSTISVWNTWAINNSYTGGDGDVICIGFPFAYTIVNTPAQPVGITSPNGNYLHTASVEGIADGITCCSFGAADGLCIPADNTFSRMTNDVSTVGYSQVDFKFWWVCEGGSSYYGQVYYSTNAGGSWAATAPAQYNFQGSWTEQTLSLPDFGNQATLRFGFRFVNSVGLGAVDPGFAVDDVRIVGANTNPTSIAASVSPLTYCQGASLNVTYTITGTFNAGNMFTAELSDASGSFASPTEIGMAMTTTGGSIACVIPPSTPPGIGYRIRVVSDSPVTTGTDNGTNIIVYEAPYAGTDVSLSLCTGDDPVSMSTGGDAGGTWSGPSSVVGDMYDPATMEPGTYTYTVVGSGPCASDAATVVISELSGANAGSSASTVICKNTGIYDLFEFLGGSPDTGGTWTNPGGSPSDGMFNSAVQLGGIYTYTVNGGGSCGSDEAVVSVTLGEPGEAGPDGIWTICSDGFPVDLFDMLDVSANLTGVWFNNGIPFNGEADAGGDFLYIDYADVPCSNDTAFITLDVSQEAYAGENGTVQVCNDDPPLTLFSALTGAPQTGGTWTGPGGSPHSGTFIPGTDGFGLYTYTVDAIEPCDPDEAVLAVVLCEGGIVENHSVLPLHWLGRAADAQQVFSAAPMKNAVIEMYDASGRLVSTWSGVSSTGQLRLDTGALGSGAYTVRLRNGEGSGSVRFIQ